MDPMGKHQVPRGSRLVFRFQVDVFGLVRPLSALPWAALVAWSLAWLQSTSPPTPLFQPEYLHRSVRLFFFERGERCVNDITYVTDQYDHMSFASKLTAQELAQACKFGTAVNIIQGLALGYKSCIIPVFVLSSATRTKTSVQMSWWVRGQNWKPKGCKRWRSKLKKWQKQHCLGYFFGCTKGVFPEKM